MIYIVPHISIITLNINVINTSTKRQILSEWIKTKKLSIIYKKPLQINSQFKSKNIKDDISCLC
jgi:hypothetical protein